MKHRIKVVDAETDTARLIRLARKHIVTLLTAMADAIDTEIDPRITGLVPFVAYALQTFDAHPVDRRGHCMRGACRTPIFRRRRTCPAVAQLVAYTNLHNNLDALRAQLRRTLAYETAVGGPPRHAGGTTARRPEPHPPHHQQAPHHDLIAV
jgi:hypothetical protein